MQSLSLLSSLRAKFLALVKLGLEGWEDLRTLLISALSSSASCWLSLVQAASMAVIYSKLGGCLGITAKLGPLARTDLWAGDKDQLSNQVRSVRQGLRHSTRHRALQSSQENSTISWEDSLTTTPSVGSPKGLLMKNLTLSGSLTFPTNLWPQLKGLFWLKDPTLWLPPGNLLT